MEFLRTPVTKMNSIKQLLITTLLLKVVDLMKMSRIFQVHSGVKLARGKWIGSIPPYSANVKTNVGKIFMRLVEKHFPCHNKYYKLFNRNNIKLSDSCMPDMNNVIRKHNSKIVKNPAPSTTKTCNWHRKTDCPIDGNCLSQCHI